MTQKPPPASLFPSTSSDDAPAADPDSYLNYQDPPTDEPETHPEPKQPTSADADPSPNTQPAPSNTLRRTRHDGWTRHKIRDFLEALAETCSVADAAKAVHMTRQSAYRLRARLTNTPFDLAWEAALEHGLRQLAHSALDRAVNGVEQPVYFQGEQVGTRRVYNERLTQFMLLNAGRIGRNPIAREHAAQQWDLLMNRVETGPLDWRDDEEEGSPEARASEAEAREFLENGSDYRAAWIWELNQRTPREL